jgi:hypothetical protein
MVAGYFFVSLFLPFILLLSASIAVFLDSGGVLRHFCATGILKPVDTFFNHLNQQP